MENNVPLNIRAKMEKIPSIGILNFELHIQIDESLIVFGIPIGSLKRLTTAQEKGCGRTD
ncbi:hypothetical protein LPTSP2_31760 [Leptospira ellinghausenii]|uniref:Uncharacterized protein n=1 Tax=Leptospira ellinghausenii TaxID=1917822 RepID=A0A2P2DGW0_9LEPT|nr:hypothetical protein LPTSP2_31760 [Leptospira ellinghausenii]